MAMLQSVDSISKLSSALRSTTPTIDSKDIELVKDNKVKLESAWSKVTTRMYQNPPTQAGDNTQDVEFEEVTNS